MRILLYSALVFVLNTSCSKYQYVTVQGDLKPNGNNYFSHETDTVQINYRFVGYNCPVQIEIINKIGTPLYVDWRKSALILDGKTFSYWRDESVIKTSTDGYEIHWTNQVSSATSSTEGTISRKEQVSFIPPRSSINITPIQVKSTLFRLFGDGSKFNVQTKSGMKRATRYSYTFETSPLKFRSYLSLALQEDFKNTLILDNQFWVSEVVQSDYNPSYLYSTPDNQFYLSEATEAGKMGAVILGTSLLVGYIALHETDN